MQVNIPDRQLILSEQATMVEELAASLQESDIVEGVVTRVMEYGAFVSLRSPDGGMHGAVVSALLHIFTRQPSPGTPCHAQPDVHGCTSSLGILHSAHPVILSQMSMAACATW